jgi:peptidoglycan/LPS O-acetylase OafA/YrhL
MVQVDVAAPHVRPRAVPGRPYQPALDGIRGLSVALVLLFHGGWESMSGGYVGVSVFFTLSGFLITRLLIDEHAANGRIDPVRFWGRRLRRLMPASLACLLAVAALGAAGAFGDVPTLGGDLLGAVLQVANWVQIGGETSYAEQVLGVRNPLDHYWSLAIEEQFYWLWPLVAAGVLGRRRRGAIVVGLTAAAMIAAPVIAAVWGADAAYWSTPARAAEILLGASLAYLVHGIRRQPGPAVAAAGWPALAMILWAAVRWPAGSGPAYDGRLPVLALASAVLILAVQQRSPLRRALAWKPLVGLGSISYGVYLYHWPIFVLVGRHRPGGKLVTFVVEVAITLAVAAASYRWLEHPIRRGAGRPRQLLPVFGLSLAAVASLAWFGNFGAPDRYANPEQAVSQLEPVDSLVSLRPVDVAPAAPVPAPAPVTTLAEGPAVPPVGDVQVAGVPPRPVRILVVGDSTAWNLGDGLAAWATAHPDLASVSLQVSAGCGFILSGRVPADDGSSYAADCGRMLSIDLIQTITALRPDVAMLMITRTDVKAREWDPAEGVLSIDDPRFQERALADYTALTTWLLAAGVPEVAWVLPPTSRPWIAEHQEMHDAAAMDRYREIVRATVGASDPARVVALDLAGWLAGSGLDDEQMRKDGTHLDLAPALVVSDRFVGPSLVNLALGL